MRATFAILALAIPAVLAAGCSSATAPANDTVATSATGSASGTAGSPMPGMAMASTTAGAKPTATALMVCSTDIKSKVQQVLKMPTMPATTASFANGVYTCAYHLPVGLMLLSVQHSDTAAAANAYYEGLKPALGPTNPLLGLGSKAYGSTRGVAVVMKDNETLVVDARALPAVFGSEQQHRTDLANEVASDVLGCWTGDS